MDDIWASYAAKAQQQVALVPQRARLPDPATIPPREWLYGTRLIRRFVSVLAAPGGAGKTALALGIAVAVASGRGFLGEHVHHSVPVWVLNLEDPLAEMDRRVAAVLHLHGIAEDLVDGRLFLHSGRERRITMAALDTDGAVIHPDKAAVIEGCQALGIGLVVVDPLVKSHQVDENSPPQMDKVATAWAEVAEATGAAVLLLHHVRKGPPGDIDATRGAKSLTDATRAAFILATMTAEEAVALSVPERERWRHIRLDDGKSNMAPRADAARWFRLESVALGNGSPDYPSGDQVAAAALWRPPSPFRGLTVEDCNVALDAIAAGYGDGFYSAHRTGRGGERWAGRVLVEQFGLDDGAAARIVSAWLRSGLLEEAEYHDGRQRKSRMGVRVVDGLRPGRQAPAAMDAPSGTMET